MKDSRVELLEPRIAPASVLTFTDVDGDSVKITSSLGDLAGKALRVAAGMGEQLQTLDLTDPMFEGAAISITAAKSKTGDGLVHVGYVNGTGRALKSVVVDGDLGQIDAGDVFGPSQSLTVLEKLSVRSMGLYGVATQASGSPSLQSQFYGSVGSIVVQGDVRDAQIFVNQSIGTLTIGGSLIGGVNFDSGQVRTFFGEIGSATIRGDIVGGDGGSSGVLSAGTLVKATVGGSVIGGDGQLSGRVRADLGIGTLKIGHDVAGGDGEESGSVLSRGDLTSIVIGGSILGAAGIKSGRVWTFNDGNDIGSLKVGKDVHAGTGDDSGTIVARGKLLALTVGGSVIGGPGNYEASGDTGQISGRQGIGSVKIGGSLVGGAGNSSAQIFTTAGIGAVTIGGSIIGGTGTSAGAIEVNASAGALKIGRDLIGGGASRAGSIYVSNGDPVLGVVSLAIGGSIFGGGGPQTGYVYSSNGFAGSVNIGGGIIGGAGNESGVLDAGDGAKSISTRGSVLGADGPYSGQIIGKNVGSIAIGGDVRSADGTQSGTLTVTGTTQKIAIGGSVVSSAASNPTIAVYQQVGTLAIKGSVLGRPGALVEIAAGGPSDVPATEAEATAFGSVTIGGDVTFARILAANGSGRIGAVKVGGDWVASSIAAGITPGPGGYGTPVDFPNSSNPNINSRIASITIKGTIFGTAGGNDHYGFVAREIGKFSAAGVTLTPGPSTVHEFSLLTGDVTLRAF